METALNRTAMMKADFVPPWTRNQSLPAILLAVTALLPTRVAAQAAGEAPGAVLGCYAVSVGAWRPRLQPGDPWHRIPAVIRLDSSRSGKKGWKMQPNIVYPGARRPFPGAPRWMVSGDTLTLLWSNGFSPTIITLRRSGSAFIGWAVAETDDHAPGEPARPQAPVTARRRSCAGVVGAIE